jgi:hypothetical protein
LRQLLRGFSYVAGEKYSDWRIGDDVSKIGLIALVTGGGVAAAAKTGLLATAWKAVILLIMKGKAIIVGICAFLAFVAKAFLGRKTKTTSPSS